ECSCAQYEIGFAQEQTRNEIITRSTSTRNERGAACRAAQIFSSFEELAQNGRATRGRCGRVSEMFGAAIGGLCAFEELAQNGRATRGRCGTVSETFGAAIGGLCAFNMTSSCRHKNRRSISMAHKTGSS